MSEIKAMVKDGGDTVVLTMDFYTANRVLELLQQDYLHQAGVAVAGEMPSNVTPTERWELIAAYGKAVRELVDLGGIITARRYRAQKKK